MTGMVISKKNNFYQMFFRIPRGLTSESRYPFLIERTGILEYKAWLSLLYWPFPYKIRLYNSA